MTDNIQIVVENHQSGNCMFPGFKQKYPELYDVPKNAVGDKAITLTVESEGEYSEVRAALSRSGVGCRKFSEIPDKQKGFFSRLFGKAEKEQEKAPEPEPKKTAADRWKEVYDQLPKGTKKDFKDVDPEKLSGKALEEKIVEAQVVIDNAGK